MGAADPFDLQRFVTAQAPVFASALEELKKGRKRTHWMWFVFPQLRGLGSSSMATFYGIGSLEEARAYLAHPCSGRDWFSAPKRSWPSKARHSARFSDHQMT